MPIYAYRCDACGHAKDVLQKLSDPVLSVCPACGADSFRKQLTAAGFQLKGSGWYATDFKNAGAKPKPTTESEGQESSSSKDGKDAKDIKESKDTKESKDSKDSAASAERTTPSSGGSTSGASVS